jgi:hypothetical protein
MLQINPFLDCTLYSRIVVHIGQNNQDMHMQSCFLFNFNTNCEKRRHLNRPAFAATFDSGTELVY